MSDLVTRYLRSLRRDNKPHAYREPWLRLLEEFCREQGLSLGSFTTQQLEEYRRWLLWRTHTQGKLYSPNSLDQIQRTALAFFRWAHSKGKMKANPGRDLVLPRPTVPVPAPLCPEEVARLLGTPDSTTPLGLRDRAILAVLYHTGISRAGCERLVLAQVQLHARCLQLEDRKFDLEDDLAGRLSAYLWDGRAELGPAPGELALFLTSRGKRLKAGRITQMVRQTGRLAGISQAVNVRALRRARRAHSSP